MAASKAPKFDEGWTVGEILGEGTYGEVRLVLNRRSGEALAMKTIDTAKHRDAKRAVHKEVVIQKSLRHRNILKLFGQNTQGNIEYIFLEFAEGGELYDRIEPEFGMKNNEAKKYFNQLLCGLQYLHRRGITHRDLKPENILFDDKDNLKISDFGMATIFRVNGRERLLEKRCGTLPYIAPEVLTGSYKAEPADIWSCGIILTAMLTGELPWDEPTWKYHQYTAWEINSYTSLTPWTKLSNLILSLLRKILSPLPNKRINLDNLIKHRWCAMKFISEDSEISHQDVVHEPPCKRFCAMPNYEQNNSKCSLSASVIVPNAEENTICSRDDVCFSQPVLMDDMVLSTHLNLPQSTKQNVLLVKRMTRFFVSGDTEGVIKKLTSCLNKNEFWKTNKGVVTINTLDRRKMPLVFKANVIKIKNKLLMDFRLSKGCGLEFKRRFLEIKNNLGDIIVKAPVDL
ncbi:serine/threonine-protein kinase grp-like [Ctenocephalides felis]|uniref:serine/threonine-protein kinase grp-like n=1 Tax=Ctenocephalides felis TaxID=7515 RepID=UPI000E6E5B76|nr:serine/threonine-protein kinase grp-like [Ctenocephalides felis]XP_026471677.1 serine/threonine-protein kinase grp-like [Ctenocephalides felis]